MSANKNDILHLVSTAAFHHIFLEVQEACGRLYVRGDGLIAHRQNVQVQAKSSAKIVGYFAECFALMKQVCAMNVSCQISITEQEPVFVAIARQLL